MEEALLAAVRSVHFACAIVLFGQFVHRRLVTPEPQAPAGPGRATAWAMGFFLASGVIWLGLEALAMSGLPPAEALGSATLTVVAAQTVFGRFWIVRMVLAMALALALALLQRRPAHRGAEIAGLVLAALVLATIAGAGHAVADRGIHRAIHLCADGLHLIAAGAWLGALVPLIVMLSRSPELTLAVRATQRFSRLGLVAMAAIALSGVINACYMVPDIAALTASQYGRLLLAKIVLFLAIFALAAVNRKVLTPRLAGVSGGSALRQLRANAIIECVLGFGIVAIVGQLGITMPEFHHHP
jgi:copper resistance protein D